MTHRQQGNELFKVGKFLEAAEQYSDALKCDGEVKHVVLTNRAAAYLEGRRPGLALVDANEAIGMAAAWPKAHFRKAKALTMLGRLDDARRAAQAGLEVCGTTSKEAGALRAVVADVDRAVQQYYTPLREGTAVKVDSSKLDGKGIVAARAISAMTIAHHEEPLVSHRDIGDTCELWTCAHCLRSTLLRDSLPTEVYNMVYPSGAREQVMCKATVCPAVYCSVECRNIAWKKYHQALCCGNAPDSWTSTLQRTAERLQRTNPLVIARIYATVYQAVQDGASLGEAFLPFGVFVGGQEVSPEDDAIVGTLLRIFPNEHNFHDIINLDTYRYLNGVLIRNAAHTSPVSDAHVFLNESGDADRTTFLGHFNRPLEDLSDFIHSPEISSLVVSATALYAVTNTANHSCRPNAVQASTTPNHVLSTLALEDIPLGREVLISYVDECQPLDERRAKLKHHYLFDCYCPKCVEEMR